jgi:putative transposase
MIDPSHDLPVCRQAELLEISRSNVYYLPQPVCEADLVLMKRIDELHLNFPFAGARMLRDMLKLEGFEVGRKHVRTLMGKMGIVALYRKRKTSVAHPAHPIYPYLLTNLTIERANHVWASDLTYIPMKRGFVYLVAILDWATRRVLSHRVSISMTSDFCVEALEEAIAQYGEPQIFNTDRGANSPARSSPACSEPTTSRSAWTARDAGSTTCSSSGCGRASSTSMSTCMPTRAWTRRSEN